MEAGKLRHRITINRPASPQGRNAVGETINTPAPAARVYADVRPMTAAENTRNGITATDATIRVVIRYRDGLNAKATLTYRGQVLEIIGVVPGGQGNREWLEITAKARAS